MGWIGESKVGWVRLAGPAACLVLAAALFAWTHRTWTDLTVDFGREIYLPWRLAEGEVLYRDVAHFSGPVSPYLNAAAFRLFGTSLTTLIYTNLAIFVATCVGLWLVGRRMAAQSPWPAVLAVIGLCGFLQLVGTANYNFMTPYSHELTHAIALAIAIVLLSLRWADRPTVGRALAVGLVLGVQLMTKPEVCIATLSGVGVLMLIRGRAVLRMLPASVVAVVIGACAPGLLAVALLARSMPAAQAFSGVAGAWKHIADPVMRAFPFYQQVMGTDRLSENLQAAGSRFILLAAGLGLMMLVSRRLGDVSRSTARSITLSLFIAAGLSTMSDQTRVGVWAFLPLGFVFLLPCLTAVFFVRSWRDRADARSLAAACVGTLASVLLAKIALRATAGHYGFALLLPGVFFFFMCGTAILPEWIDKTKRDAQSAASGESPATTDPTPHRGWLVRAASLAVLAAMIVSHVAMTAARIAPKTALAGQGADRFWIDPSRQAVRDTLSTMAQFHALAGPDETLAVLPEGAMINYLTRRANPTGYIVTMPVEIKMFGEPPVLKAFEKSPPDWVILRISSMSFEYGVDRLEHMPAAMRYIEDHYEPITDPVTSMRLLRRR